MTQREFFTIIANGMGTVTDKNADKTIKGTRTINLMQNPDDFAEGLNAEIIEYAQAQIATLNAKNANRKTSKAETERKAANAELAQAILATFEKDKTYTARFIADTFNISTQKATAIIKPYIEDGTLKVIDGYKAEGAKSKCKGYTLA